MNNKSDKSDIWFSLLVVVVATLAIISGSILSRDMISDVRSELNWAGKGSISGVLSKDNQELNY